MFQIRLKELREKAGYSQYSFASAFGVAQSTVGGWEAGKREPNFETLQRLADFFDVSIDYLLGQEENEKAPPIYDDEAWELMEEMHKRPELKVLFSTSKKVKKEDIELVEKMLKRMAGEESGD